MSTNTNKNVIRRFIFEPSDINKYIVLKFRYEEHISWNPGQFGSRLVINKHILNIRNTDYLYGVYKIDWYDDYTNKKDNYYEGTYTYKQGEEALKEMGYNEKEFIQVFGDKIAKDNIYSLELTPQTAFIEGKDQSETFLPKGTKWWFILIIKSEGGAIAYNKTLDIRYHLESQ